MKIVETERIYCIEITNRQMEKLLARDYAVRSSRSRTGFQVNAGNMVDRLLRIRGVRDVKYDPMHGPTVFVRVESEDHKAMAETLEKTKKEIAKYVR